MTQGYSGGAPDGRPLNPAAERNKEPIRRVLERVLPSQGTVVEVASGTGTHALYFAHAMPRLVWQPSEADPELRAVMAENFRTHAPANLRMPLALDARQRWELDHADALVCVNLTHVAPWAATEALFDGAARVLSPHGVIVIYGPFRRGGQHTAESNRAFDEALRARDPEWGLRDIEALQETAGAHNLQLTEIVEMPANNFCLVFTQAV